jgi:sodium/potassium-transporting ATPase subunit alpha
MSPALSLMLEKPETELLKRPPRDKNKHLVDWKLILQAYAFLGLFEGFFSHVMYFYYLNAYGGFTLSDLFFVYSNWGDGYKNYTQTQLNDYNYTGQTVIFVALVFMQIFGNIYVTRTNLKSLFQSPPFAKRSRNLWIFAAEIVSMSFTLIIVFLPPVNQLFNTRTIPAQFFFIPLAIALFMITLDELRKLGVRKKIGLFVKSAW